MTDPYHLLRFYYKKPISVAVVFMIFIALPLANPPHFTLTLGCPFWRLFLKSFSRRLFSLFDSAEFGRLMDGGFTILSLTSVNLFIEGFSLQSRMQTRICRLLRPYCSLCDSGMVIEPMMFLSRRLEMTSF
jgi:hypothetical protein